MIILSQETKSKFGYLPSELKPSSDKKVICKCEKCSILLERKFRMAKRNRICSKCSNAINANTSLDKRSASVKKFWSENPHPRLGKNCHGKRGIYAGVNMRSSWEIQTAKFLDAKGIKWIYEPKSFPITIKGKSYTYTPDFLLPEYNCYIEVKGYWRDNAKEKFDQFQQEYMNINIRIWERKNLKSMGII